MSMPPPLLPEEQVRLVQDELRRKRRGRKWLWGFLIVSVLINMFFFSISMLKLLVSEPKGNDSIFVERYIAGDKHSNNKISVIRIQGVIASEMEGHMGFDGMVGDIREQLRLAVEDEDVKAIIVRIDSPGGEVLASDEIYRAIRKAQNSKPVVCSMGSLAASGGYYSAVGAQYIIADDLTITGSIGVIMQTLNYKGLFDKVGLKSVVFKSGKFKDILNGGREPTEEENALVQALIMETYEKFLHVVATERKLDAENLRNTIADGRILSGQQALAAKLVDATGNFQDAIKKAMELGKIQDAKVLDYAVPFSFRNLFGSFAESNKKPTIEINTSTQAFPLQQGKLYYISLHLF